MLIGETIALHIAAFFCAGWALSYQTCYSSVVKHTILKILLLPVHPLLVPLGRGGAGALGC